MTTEHDYQIAAEPDVSGKVNRHIWFYFIILGVMLSATLIGLTIMYQFQLDYEKRIKIGMVNTEESTELRNRSQSYLAGKSGLLEGKRYVAIETAIKQFVNDARKSP